MEAEVSSRHDAPNLPTSLSRLCYFLNETMKQICVPLQRLRHDLLVALNPSTTGLIPDTFLWATYIHISPTQQPFFLSSSLRPFIPYFISHTTPLLTTSYDRIISDELEIWSYGKFAESLSPMNEYADGVVVALARLDDSSKLSSLRSDLFSHF